MYIVCYSLNDVTTHCSIAIHYNTVISYVGFCRHFMFSFSLFNVTFFFREDDLLTCKNQQKTKQNNNNTRAQGKIIDNIFLH